MSNMKGAGGRPSAEQRPADLCKCFSRVKSHGPHRLNVATFLGGFTLAAFAALLSAEPLRDPAGVAAATLLGAAAVLLLLTAVSGTMAMEKISDISQQGVETLTGADRVAEGTGQLQSHDQECLLKAYRLYDRGATLVILGECFSIASLMIIASRTNPAIGIVIAVMTVGALLWLQLWQQVPPI